ncbi:MAG: hypothetical protein ACLTWO_03780 [Blautia massiliensis (ex Durand et al. 2017)]
MFDFYSCPYDPDTGPVPCGEKNECVKCCWFKCWQRLNIPTEN